MSGSMKVPLLGPRLLQAGVPGRPGQAHSQRPAGGEAIAADQRNQIQRKRAPFVVLRLFPASFVWPKQTEWPQLTFGWCLN